MGSEYMKSWGCLSWHLIPPMPDGPLSSNRVATSRTEEGIPKFSWLVFSPFLLDIGAVSCLDMTLVDL